MCKFISNKLRETSPAGRGKLRRGIRLLFYILLQPTILPFKTICEIGVKEQCVPFHINFELVSDVGCWLPSKTRNEIGVIVEYVRFHSGSKPFL